MHNKAYPHSCLMVHGFKTDYKTVQFIKDFFGFETDFKGLKSGNIENRPGTKKTICTVARLWWRTGPETEKSDPEFPKIEHSGCKKIKQSHGFRKMTYKMSKYSWKARQ